MVDVSGKIGGTIFSKNRGGNYAKNRVIPNNPATSRQSLVRGRFGSLSSQWRLLTQGQRDSFTAASVNFPRTNRIGDTILLAGNALFVSLNTSLLNVGLPIITAAPSPQGVTEFVIDDFNAFSDVALELMNVSATAIDPLLQDVMKVEVFATAPVSAGISNVTSLFRQIAVFDGNQFIAGENLSILEDYKDVFGAFTTGSRIGVKLLPVNSVTGESGVGTTKLTIVG